MKKRLNFYLKKDLIHMLKMTHGNLSNLKFIPLQQLSQ